MRLINVVSTLLLVVVIWPFSPDLSSVATARAEEAPFSKIAISLNDQQLNFDVEPRIWDDEVFIPLRKVFETMGYLVEWDEEMRRITIYGQERVVVLYPESELYSVNGTIKRAEKLLFIENGRSLVNLNFFQGLTVADEIEWDEQNKYLNIVYIEEEHAVDKWPDNDLEDEYVNFIEVQLPGEQVDIGEAFDVHIGAPFIPGVHTYEIRFSYDPEVIQVKDISNPAYRSGEEYFQKDINNEEGQAIYTQALLGYKETIPPRKDLVVLSVEAIGEGDVPFIEGTLEVVLLDNKSRDIPVSKEEAVLYVASPENVDLPEAGESAEK